MDAGETEIEVPVPTNVPPQLPEYQFHTPPGPSEPPVNDKVVAPLQMGLRLADALVAGVDNVLTVTATETQAVVLQVPSALTK